MRCSLLTLIVPALLHAQVLQDDFSGSTLDPLRWSVVTAGVPGSPSVSLQGGECLVRNRGYLVTADQFDPVALGGIRVTGAWRWSSEYDQFNVLTRCDAVPSGPYGEASDGIALHADWETPPHFTLTAHGTRIVLGPVTMTGGFDPQSGLQYRFELEDLGGTVRGRIEGPNNTWVELSCLVVSDTTTTRRVVFYNRELVFQNDCRLDDVVIEPYGTTSTYVLLQTAMTWDQANAQAQAMGGHLVVIDNQVENDWLRDHLLQQNTSCWIGARKVNGIWGWVDGSPFTYTNWDQGQPDNQNGIQDRARMWWGGTPGAWDDTDNLAQQVWAIVELPRARWTTLGTGCVGSNGVPRLSATSRPVLGQTFTMTFGNLPTQPGPMIAFAGFVAQVTPLGGIGMPGCTGQLLPAIDAFLTHNGSTATWPVSVPSDPALGDFHVYLQAAVPDAGATTPLQATVTNAIDAVLGF